MPSSPHFVAVSLEGPRNWDEGPWDAPEQRQKLAWVLFASSVRWIDTQDLFFEQYKFNHFIDGWPIPNASPTLTLAPHFSRSKCESGAFLTPSLAPSVRWRCFSPPWRNLLLIRCDDIHPPLLSSHTAAKPLSLQAAKHKARAATSKSGQAQHQETHKNLFWSFLVFFGLVETKKYQKSQDH
jgi:hypothetical protein